MIRDDRHKVQSRFGFPVRRMPRPVQGCGEFVRLAMEEGGAQYRDVARESGKGAGIQGMMRLLNDLETPPFAPPILRAGRLFIGQTANILQFLGPRLGIAPKSEAGRLWTHQLQLTIADFLVWPGRRRKLETHITLRCARGTPERDFDLSFG
jgi:hypothetical protein